MSENIANKSIVLKLNKNWQPLEVAVVGDIICDMVRGVVVGLDIQYESNPDGTPNYDTQYPVPTPWEQWINLPVRDCDLVIHSCKMVIRVPTVVVTANFDKMPKKEWKPTSKPTKEGLYIRDGGKDGYTGLDIDYEEATIDHILPKSKGGSDTYDNTCLTLKETNNWKSDRLNHEVGLKLRVVPCVPKPILASQQIRKVRHRDWKFFLDHFKKKKK